MPIQGWIQTDCLNEPEHQWIVMTYLLVRTVLMLCTVHGQSPPGVDPGENSTYPHVLLGRQPNTWNINFLVEIIS